MSVWKSLARAFGFSNEARVQISAPGIEVVLTGDPDKVHALLHTVKQELERGPRRRRRNPAYENQRESQIVRPTELDEMDSPYALPEAMAEAMVQAVEEDTDGGERVERVDTPRTSKPAPSNSEPPQEVTAVGFPSDMQTNSGEMVTDGDVVAVVDDRRVSDFSADAGPTLISDDDERLADPVQVFSREPSST